MKATRNVFDIVRHMVRIGEHPEHKALRERNEARLAELKRSKSLYETQRRPNVR
jgi:hypothetical protein